MLGAGLLRHSLEHLGGPVVHLAAPDGREAAPVEARAYAEVYQFQLRSVAGVLEDQVAGVQVVVRDALVVAVGNCVQDVVHVARDLGLVLVVVGLQQDLVHQALALQQLADYVEGVGGLDHLVDLHDVRVVQRF